MLFACWISGSCALDATTHSPTYTTISNDELLSIHSEKALGDVILGGRAKKARTETENDGGEEDGPQEELEECLDGSDEELCLAGDNAGGTESDMSTGRKEILYEGGSLPLPFSMHEDDRCIVGDADDMAGSTELPLDDMFMDTEFLTMCATKSEAMAKMQTDEDEPSEGIELSAPEFTLSSRLTVVGDDTMRSVQRAHGLTTAELSRVQFFSQLSVVDPHDSSRVLRFDLAAQDAEHKGKIVCTDAGISELGDPLTSYNKPFAFYTLPDGRAYMECSPYYDDADLQRHSPLDNKARSAGLSLHNLRRQLDDAGWDADAELLLSDVVIHEKIQDISDEAWVCTPQEYKRIMSHRNKKKVIDDDDDDDSDKSNHGSCTRGPSNDRLASTYHSSHMMCSQTYILLS